MNNNELIVIQFNGIGYTDEKEFYSIDDAIRFLKKLKKEKKDNEDEEWR